MGAQLFKLPQHMSTTLLFPWEWFYENENDKSTSFYINYDAPSVGEYKHLNLTSTELIYKGKLATVNSKANVCSMSPGSEQIKGLWDMCGLSEEGRGNIIGKNMVT